MFLVIDLDKGTDRPALYNRVPSNIFRDADEGLSLIINLDTRRRYIRYEWHDIETFHTDAG